MRKKILIYGYGWVGESAYDFFRYFGFDCKIIDDLLDFSEISFFNSDFRMDIDILEFDFYIVAICNKKTAISLKDKLISMGVNANQIKNFSSDKYNKNMEYLLDEYFIDSIDTFLNDEFSLDRLHNSLKNVVCKHYENKKSNNLKHRRLEFDKKVIKACFLVFCIQDISHPVVSQ